MTIFTESEYEIELSAVQGPAGGFPTIANNTMLGNTSGATAVAVARTAQQMGVVLATDTQTFSDSQKTVARENIQATSLRVENPKNTGAELLLGAGNLHRWYERQFNAITESTVAGANKRMSILVYGDSLGRRLGGWITSYMEKEFPQFINWGYGLDFGGPMVSNPISYVYTGGLIPTKTGDVVESEDAFTDWIDGQTFSIGSGTGTLTFSSLLVPSTQTKVYFISESGAGSFVLETSPDGTTWTQQGAAISASNATKIGSVQLRSYSYGLYFVRIRHTSGGRVKIIGVLIGHPNSTPGFECSTATRGGLSISLSMQCPSAVYTPILTDMNPSLVTIQFEDPLSEWETNWTALMNMVRAGDPYRSVLIVLNGPTQYTDAQVLEVNKFLRSKVVSDNIAVWDQSSILGTSAYLEGLGWRGDGNTDSVHLSDFAYAYSMDLCLKNMNVISRLSESLQKEEIYTDRLVLGKDYARLSGNPGRYIMDVTLKDSNVGVDVTLPPMESYIKDWNGNVLYCFSWNENRYPNQHPQAIWRPNGADQGGQNRVGAAYRNMTTGNTSYIDDLHNEIIRNEETNQVLVLGPKTASVTLSPGTINAGAEVTLTATVTGAQVLQKNTVSLGWASALPAGIIVCQAWVSDWFTVSIRLRNVTGSNITVNSIVCNLAVFGTDPQY